MNDGLPPLETATARESGTEKRIGLAAATGFGAKVLGLATQVVAVAIAVRGLGAEGFALYVVIASLVSWLGLAGLGVAPGLTLGIARTTALGDRAEEARLFMVAMLLMTAVATVLVGFAAVLTMSGFVEFLVAGWLGTASEDASTALLYMTLIIALQLVVVVPEAAQLGLQTQHISNTWAALGSATAIVAMVSASDAVTSVTTFVLISQGPQVAARAVNGVVFVLRRRHLRSVAGLRFRRHAWPILGSGIAFAGVSLSSYVALHGGLLIMAATGDGAAVALAGVIVRGYMLEVSGLSLITTPTWPAIAAAVTRGDLPWVRRTYRMLARAGMIYAGIAATAVAVGLEALIGAWTGARPAENAALRLLLATFVLTNAWAHINAMTLIGLGALRFTAAVLVFEGMLVLALLMVVVPLAGVTGFIGGLAVGTTCVSAWVLPFRVRRELSRGDRSRTPSA